MTQLLKIMKVSRALKFLPPLEVLSFGALGYEAFFSDEEIAVLVILSDLIYTVDFSALIALG
jgi:hypothetical protein